MVSYHDMAYIVKVMLNTRYLNAHKAKICVWLCGPIFKLQPNFEKNAMDDPKMTLTCSRPKVLHVFHCDVHPNTPEYGF